MKTTQPLLFLLIIITTTMTAQTNTFKAGATIGANFSQMDGDRELGYQKKGVNLGIRGGIVFNKNWEVLTELLYNTKGAEPTSQEKKTSKRLITTDLKYAEVPILLKFSFLPSEQGYYKWNVFAGFSYGRLLQSKVSILKNDLSIDTAESNIVNQRGFKSSDISVIVGASRYFSPRLGLSIKHTTSLTTCYNNPNPTARTSALPEGYSTLRNYFLSVNLFYDFIAPKMVVKKSKKGTPQ